MPSCSLQSSPCLRPSPICHPQAVSGPPLSFFLRVPALSFLLLTAKASGPLSTLGPLIGYVPFSRPGSMPQVTSCPTGNPPFRTYYNQVSPCSQATLSLVPHVHSPIPSASALTPDNDEAYNPNRWPQPPAVLLTHQVSLCCSVWSEFLDSSNPPASDSGVAEITGAQLQTCLKFFPSFPVLGR